MKNVIWNAKALSDLNIFILLYLGMACRHELFTPQAPDVTFFRGFTLLHGFDILPILSLSTGLYGIRLLDFGVYSFLDYIKCVIPLQKCKFWFIWIDVKGIFLEIWVTRTP